MLTTGPEQVENLIETQLERILACASLDSLLRQVALLILQVNDSFLNGISDADFVHDHVDRLCETVHSIYSLLFHKLFIFRSTLASQSE
jgi:hypothetical protein